MVVFKLYKIQMCWFSIIYSLQILMVDVWSFDLFKILILIYKIINHILNFLSDKSNYNNIYIIIILNFFNMMNDQTLCKKSITWIFKIWRKYYFIKNIELSTILLTNIPTLAALSLSLLSYVGRRIWDGEHELWWSRSFAWSD